MPTKHQPVPSGPKVRIPSVLLIHNHILLKSNLKEVGKLYNVSSKSINVSIMTQAYNARISRALLSSFMTVWHVVLNIFTALHEMQTRSSDENSVCPSVHLSVCLSVTRVIPDKMEERSVHIFIPYERTIILVF